MLQYSPKIVTDSLVMCLDASNNKSYPTDLPVKNGLVMWMDAADDTTFSYSSGTSVSQWRDKSGNNFHANQSTTGQQPSRNTINNSRKSVFFNAASRLDYMTISSGISLPTDASIFIIYKPSTQIYEYAVLIDNYHGQGGNYGFVIQRVSTNSQFYYANAGDGTGFIDTSASPWTYTDNVIQLLSLNKASSTGTPYISGTAQTSRSVRAATAQSTTGLAIGYWGNGGGRFYNGDMCEILIFNRALSSTEMKQVHTYLGQKWGISNTDRSIVDLSGNNKIISLGGDLGSQVVADMPTFDYYNKGAFFFDGSTDTILTNIPITATPALSNFTYEMWTKLTNFPTVASANIYGSTTRAGFLMGASSYGGAGLLWNGNASGTGCVIYGFIRGADAYRNTSAYSLALNQYYHLVLVNNYGANKLQLFVNGSLYNEVSTATAEYDAGSAAGAGNIGIAKAQVDGGGTQNYTKYAGSVPLARIYNKALTATEVSQNYEAQKSKFANTIVQQGLVLNLDAGNPYSYAGAGTTMYDVSPTALSWTINNATYNSSDPKYFSYNGSNSWLQSSTSAAYDSQTITMECWCYPNSLNQYGFLFEKGAVNTQYSMFFENANFQFRTFGLSNQDVTITSASHMTVNAWNHIVCTYASGNKITYINGVQAGGLSGITGTLNTGGTNQYIGKYGNAGNNYPFNGRIAESRVYNIALSAAQVLQNYNATKGKFGL